MAQPDIIRGTYFSLMLGNGATPTEVFTALCGFTTRNFTDQVNTNDVFTRDCADPEDIPIRRLIPTGRQWDLTGEGQLNRSNLEAMQAAHDAQAHNWRFLFTEPTNDWIFQGFYAGPAIITSLQITAADDDFATVSLTLASDGQWAFTEVQGS
jgi:predicted secreted protein